MVLTSNLKKFQITSLHSRPKTYKYRAQEIFITIVFDLNAVFALDELIQLTHGLINFSIVQFEEVYHRKPHSTFQDM